MINYDTIAAISTPVGEGSISIIRISGKDAKQIADKVFSAKNKKPLQTLKGYTGAYGRVFSSEEEIDECVAYVYTAPKSYTGEDVVELCCHGGAYMTGKVLSACVDAGARLAEPGEFTKRAFLNGKLSLTQAEAVMDIISSHNEQGARAALAAKDGALYRKIEEVLDQLLAVASHLAAWIDYPEEEIAMVEESQLKLQLEEILNEIKILNNTYSKNLMLKNGIDTAIVGRPNVGKSTLMNLLAGYEKSIVTHIPGTTRDIVEDTIKLDDVILRLFDTAGVRETDDPVEQIGVKKAWEKIDRAQLILAVFDRSEPLTEEDKTLLDKIAPLPVIAVINKTDMPAQLDLTYIQQKIKHIVEISAKFADGIEILQQKIKQLLSIEHFDSAAPMIANERQRDCVQRAQQAIITAINAVESGVTLDAVGVLIDDAIEALLELNGKSVTEEVVNGVFAKFCVGK